MSRRRHMVCPVLGALPQTPGFSAWWLPIKAEGPAAPLERCRPDRIASPRRSGRFPALPCPPRGQQNDRLVSLAVTVCHRPKRGYNLQQVLPMS
jgi:hypothetical protein